MAAALLDQLLASPAPFDDVFDGRAAAPVHRQLLEIGAEPLPEGVLL